MQRYAFMLLILLGSTLLSISCQQKNKSLLNRPVLVDAAHNSRNSIDWEGTYIGTLPCSDCDGLATVLEINKNGTYIISTTPAGKTNGTLRHEGSFAWNKNGSVIELSGAAIDNRYFLIGENVLILLDKNVERYKAEQSDRYWLIKKIENEKNTDQLLLASKWVLTALNGKSVQTSENKSPIYIAFNAKEGMVSGSGGCNRFFGQFVLQGGMRIRFTSTASTLMACDDLATEGEFFQMLEKADNYSISNGLLMLHKAKMAPLAVFRAEGPN